MTQRGEADAQSLKVMRPSGLPFLVMSKKTFCEGCESEPWLALFEAAPRCARGAAQRFAAEAKADGRRTLMLLAVARPRRNMEAIAGVQE